MKLIKLTAVFMTLAWLSGCSTLGGSKDDADESSGATDVVVEDRNAESSGIEGENIEGGGNIGAETTVIVGEEQYQGNEFNDPTSPLSNRIVYFEYDSSTVRAEDQVTLEAHAAYLADNPNVTVRLVGHTDERGSREYNLALGERRALSIRQLLMLHGAGINQFEVTSLGEERSQVEGFDESAWQQNRRVELNY